jgi:hypothetical protein
LAGAVRLDTCPFVFVVIKSSFALNGLNIIILRKMKN